jgi:hypothetical protein
MQLIKQLKAARAVSTPLIAITTTDQPGITKVITEQINGSTPVVRWDRSRGYQALNDYAKPVIERMLKKLGCSLDELPMVTSDPANALRLATTKFDDKTQVVPAKVIIIAQSMNVFLNEMPNGEIVQGVLNCRDAFKSNQRMLIMLSQDFRFPAESQNVVILLDDPLPSDEQYGKTVEVLHEAAKFKKPEADYTNDVVRSVRGLSGFEAEQVLAMSMAMNPKLGKIDTANAWELKRKAVSKVPGLTMTLDGPPLADLRGLDQITDRTNRLWMGPNPPELIVRVDEIDKALAGLGSGGGPGDNTGVTQDLLQQLLINMEDHGWKGAILMGVRGAGKTVFSEAIGKAHSIPTIAMDVGEMKGAGGGIVGTAEAAYRNAFRTIKSIGGSRVLVLATCNQMEVLPPELLRRFKLNIWFFDVLSAEERESLWPIYLNKYNLDADQELPDDSGWTGAEIRNCCELAYDMALPVAEVGSTMIVPITQSDPRSVQEMQSTAEAKGYLSVAYPGKYRKAGESEVDETSGRALNL